MGCSYHSNAVIGVPLDRLLEKKKVKTSITKYNENTGKPYQQEVIETHYEWCGVEVEEPDDMEDFVKKMCGLGVYDAGHHNDGPIVGIELGCGEPGEIVAVNGADVSKAWTDVKEKLLKSGYKDNGIQLHIISYVS